MPNSNTNTNASLPETMKVIEISRPGSPEVLEQQERRVPMPGPGEILIKVSAAGVNRPDIMQRQGNYRPPKDASDLPGLEVSGTVVKLGRSTNRYALGEQVCALCPGGGYAEYVVVPETHALPIPRGYSLLQAAALPETFFTVWTNVFQRGQLKAGDVFLVHGGSSGIGTAAIQMAKLRGAKVIATAGSDEKCAACTALGADHAINYHSTDYVEAVKDLTDGNGANVILDMVGGDYIERNYKAAAVDGRIVQIAFQNGAISEVNFILLMTKRLTHTGSTLRPQTVQMKSQIASDLEQEIWPLLNDGSIKPVIDSTFSLIEARKAHERLETGNHVGKVMLDVDGTNT